MIKKIQKTKSIRIKIQITIFIKCVFQKDTKYYPQVFFMNFCPSQLIKIYILEYDMIDVSERNDNDKFKKQSKFIT